MEELVNVKYYFFCHNDGSHLSPLFPLSLSLSLSLSLFLSLSLTHTHILELNECSDPFLNACHMNALCTDVPGSYVCNCLAGFEGNGTFCESE